MPTEVPPHSFHGGKEMPLSDLLAGSRTWERTVVPIGASFRLAVSVVGLLSASIVVAQIVLWHAVLPYEKPGLFLIGWPWVAPVVALIQGLFPLYCACTALLLALLALTVGFREAGRRVQLGLATIATTSAAGLILPAIVALTAAVNLVLWLAIGAAIVAIVLLCLAALFDAL